MIPALIERARDELALARVVGKFTVDLGVRKVRRRLVDHVDPITTSAGGGTVEILAEAATADDVPAAPVDDQVAPASTIRVGELVLPDYDHLPAVHVVAKLASLTQHERDGVEQYETANRHRRTILGKLDQLRVR